MCDSRRQEDRVGEEKGRPQPGRTRPTKCVPAKKSHVGFDEDVPAGFPLKPVHHKRSLSRRPGPGLALPEDRETGRRNGGGQTHVGGLAADRPLHPRTDPDERRRQRQRSQLAKAIHEKELLILQRLWKTEQSMKRMILQDGDNSSSETWRGQPGGRRDEDVRTEGGGVVGHPHGGQRNKKRPERVEEHSDHRARASGHLHRRGQEGMEVKELNRDRERRSIHLSAKMRGDSQWSQARAQEGEDEEDGHRQQQQRKLSEEKAPEKRWERNSMGRHGSSGEEREQGGQQRSVHHGQGAKHHSGKERPHLQRSSNRPQAADPIPEEKTDASLQLLSCKYCERRFAAARLEKHLTICERLHQSQRKVYDSSKHRILGTEMETFRQNRGIGYSSEVKKSTGRQKQGSQNSPDPVTCPHCSRHFAPGPAERHIPKCQNIRSRPPPPPTRHRQ
ncbi:unnamed protein product [Merluccius merluccius]